MKSEEFYESIKAFNPNLQVVVAFRMMPERIWSFPKYGSLNLHASLLPDYRGAAPIHWAIINGERETGVTTFFLKHEIDTGDIILQAREEIRESDTLGSLYERLKMKGADTLLQTIRQISKGELGSNPQEVSKDLHKAPKIFKEDARVDWNANSRKIYDLVRGTNPFPGAWAEINGQRINLYKVSIVEKQSAGSGVIETDGKSFAHIGCSDKMIALEEIQAKGGKRLGIRDYLNGNQL